MISIIMLYHAIGYIGDQINDFLATGDKSLEEFLSRVHTLQKLKATLLSELSIAQETVYDSIQSLDEKRYGILKIFHFTSVNNPLFY
ncbi:hypothetical protein B6A27_03320 [Anoxybacillus sp. UARK-01]|nr:hypothetical protein B6A27_03320 [Anoxybacillus sp. UARK-01]